jgi:hypothetical protein
MTLAIAGEQRAARADKKSRPALKSARPFLCLPKLFETKIILGQIEECVKVK